MEKFDFEKYDEAGCFDEETAELLYDMGVSPEQAGEDLPEDEGVGQYKATIGYKLSNGDINIDDVIRILNLK